MKEKHTQNDCPFMLIRFGSKERLEDLQKGCLYMKNLLYFINLEKNDPTGSGGQGDIFEAQSVIYNPYIKITNIHTQTLIYQGTVEISAIGFGYEKYPVLCMFMLDSRNLVNQKVDGDKLIRSYQFTPEQIDRIGKTFGDYALMIFDADEFVHRVKNGLAADNVVQFTRGQVQYYRPNDYNYSKDISNNHLNAPFWKREIFAFQQEFRILVHKAVSDHLRVNIGNIGDISQLFKASDLLNSQIDITFNVQNGADPHA